MRLVGEERADFARQVWTLHQSGKTWREIQDSIGDGDFTPTEGQIKAALRDYQTIMARHGKSYNDAEAGGETQSPVAPEKNVDPLSMDDMVDFFARWSAMQTAEDPVPVIHEIELPAAPALVRFWSCYHLGGKYTDHHAGLRLLNEMLNIPGGYLVSLGDDTEGFPPGFPDVEAQRQQQALDLQFAALRLLLERLSADGRLLWGHAGQHSGDWFVRRWGHNPVEAAYKAVQRMYFSGLAYTKLRVGEQVYFIGSAHVFPGFSMYNPLHPLMRAVREHFPLADLVIQGDKHTAAMGMFPAYQLEHMIGNRASESVLLIQVGTAKTGNDRYTIHRFPPGQLGWPVVMFRHDRHEVRAAWELADALKF